MGLLLSSIWNMVHTDLPRPVPRARKYRVLMTGLEGAGTSSILQKLGETAYDIQSLGFEVERVEYQNLSILGWSTGNHQLDRAKPLWEYSYENTSGIIFIVDSVDQKKLARAEVELHSFLEMEELVRCPLLVMANKQDLAEAASVGHITDALDLQTLDRSWRIQNTCTMDFAGIQEGIEWLAEEIVNKPTDLTGDTPLMTVTAT